MTDREKEQTAALYRRRIFMLEMERERNIRLHCFKVAAARQRKIDALEAEYKRWKDEQGM